MTWGDVLIALDSELRATDGMQVPVNATERRQIGWGGLATFIFDEVTDGNLAAVDEDVEGPISLAIVANRLAVAAQQLLVCATKIGYMAQYW